MKVQFCPNCGNGKWVLYIHLDETFVMCSCCEFTLKVKVGE